MNNLEYKGYYGSIEYSQDDDCLFGKVLGMPNNLISYEGNTATELYADFKDAIDTYLDYCHGTSINSFIRDSIEKRLDVTAAI